VIEYWLCATNKQPTLLVMNWDQMFQVMTYAGYRVSTYVLMNLGEDAALVALMFC
jgi:hypothetical protein